MKTHHLFHMLLLASLCTLALLACGGDPAPIRVYVTPTHEATPLPSETVPATHSQPVDTLVSQGITPQPTPALIPGVNYGPIVGSDYTPEALHTPLPQTVSVRPCPVIISAPQVSLYQLPDLTSPVVGSAAERENLDISAVSTAPTGILWVSTARGWLPLTDPQGAALAQLGSMRACDILLGKQADTTLMGLHVINSTQNEAVLRFVQRMADSGHPLGTIKGLNGTESLLAQVKQISPQTIIVYRSLLFEGGQEMDCPLAAGTNPDPIQTAQHWLAGLKPYWDQVNADYYEFMNECTASMDWISQFSIEAMRIANGQGRCLLLFSFPGGNPDMNEFSKLYPAYRYAAENPCASGRTHGIALHAYSLQDNKLTSESDVWYVFRHRLFYQRLLVDVPEAANLPVFVTEMGIGGGTLFPGCDMVIKDAVQYTYELEEDPYVKGFHLWSVGTGAQWYDISPCLDDLATNIIAYYGGPK